MRAAVLHGPRDLRMETVQKPTLKPNLLLVNVKACGVCNQTDFRLYSGEYPPYGEKYPCLFGHECTGKVVACGPGVSEFEEGDRVVIRSWAKGFAEYTLTREDLTVHLPKKITYTHGVVAQLMVPCLNTVMKTVKPGDNVYVAGQGPVGLVLTQLCRLSGAATIVASDLCYERLEIAKRLGADYTVNVTMNDPVEELGELFPEGVDASIEAAGTVEAFHTCTKVLCRGGRLGAVGLPSKAVGIDVKEWTYKATSMVTARELVPEESKALLRRAVRILERGLIKYKPLITHVFPLDKLEEVFQMIEKEPEKIIKAVIKP